MQDEKSILKLNILKRNSENFTRIFKVILTLVISAPANQIKSLKQKKKKKTFHFIKKKKCVGPLQWVISNFQSDCHQKLLRECREEL